MRPPPLSWRPALRSAGLSQRNSAIQSWVTKLFGMGWAGEAAAAVSRMPPTCLVAVRDRALLGFACWDVAALGLFGPLGVDPASERRGIGSALTRRALAAMREQGYAYAVIGAIADPAFYEKAVGARAIEGSTPGLFGGLLKAGATVPNREGA